MTSLLGPSLPGFMLVLAVAGCDAAPRPAEQPTSEAINPSPLRVSESSPVDTIDPMTSAANRLLEVARSGQGNPQAEAERAMDNGDFRFVGYLFLVPGGWPAAYGVECRPSIAFRRELVGAVYTTSDIPPRDEEEQEARRTDEANLRRFGAAFNRAVLDDPRFPYHDECKAVPVGDARERGDPLGMR